MIKHNVLCKNDGKALNEPNVSRETSIKNIQTNVSRETLVLWLNSNVCIVGLASYKFGNVYN